MKNIIIFTLCHRKYWFSVWCGNGYSWSGLVTQFTKAVTFFKRLETETLQMTYLSSYLLLYLLSAVLVRMAKSLFCQILLKFRNGGCWMSLWSLSLSLFTWCWYFSLIKRNCNGLLSNLFPYLLGRFMLHVCFIFSQGNPQTGRPNWTKLKINFSFDEQDSGVFKISKSFLQAQA